MEQRSRCCAIACWFCPHPLHSERCLQRRHSHRPKGASASGMRAQCRPAWPGMPVAAPVSLRASRYEHRAHHRRREGALCRLPERSETAGQSRLQPGKRPLERRRKLPLPHHHVVAAHPRTVYNIAPRPAARSAHCWFRERRSGLSQRQGPPPSSPHVRRRRHVEGRSARA